MKRSHDDVEFDDDVLVALARSASAHSPAPGAHVKSRLMAAIGAEAPLPRGFTIHRDNSGTWERHPVAGIRMKVLSTTAAYVTLLLDVAPGTRFPPHLHEGAEECYVVRGSLHTCGRQLHAGDFVHADADTYHGELYSDEGCQVLLVVPPHELREWRG